MHVVDRHLMDPAFGFGQDAQDGHGMGGGAGGQRRGPDTVADVTEAPGRRESMPCVRMGMRLRGIMRRQPGAGARHESRLAAR